jgi:hypothetical protein
MATRSLFLKVLLLVLFFLAADLGLFHILKLGMDKYYGFTKKADILLVGHSHTVLGLDAEKLEQGLNVPVAKYATAGANVLDRYWMIRQYVETHPSVRFVVYDVDPRLFDSEGLSSASYTLFLPYLDDRAMASYMKQEATWQEYYSGRLVRTTRFRDQTLNIALRGLFDKVENKKAGRFNMNNVENYLAREQGRAIRLNPESIQCFRDTIAYLTDQNISVILLFIPVVDLLNDIDPAAQERVVEIFEDAARDNNVFFFNYNDEYEHKHELFYDLRHLNREGNRLVTDRLSSDLGYFLQTSQNETKGTNAETR